MSVNEEGRMFFTPPMNNTKFDMSQSIKESYKSNPLVLQEELQDSGSPASGSNVELTKDEIDQEIGSIHELPCELSKQIDAFIYDLKQPKYMKPLTINQLALLFQGFYTKFDKASFNYLVNANGAGGVNVNGNPASFLTAREHLSSGLSGIFARSRSSSGSSVRRDRRSSSLFSTDSSTVTPMLSPEEISRQLKLNELNNLRIEKYMEFCEVEVFHRLLEVGTSVPSPTKEEKHKRMIHKESFKITDLFKNSLEYDEYDKLLLEKLKCLSRLASDGKINLSQFLGLPQEFKHENSSKIEEVLIRFTNQSVSPMEKISLLLEIHEIMTYSHEMSNDEFLSLLIYYIIQNCPPNIFLNTKFVRLFRYKKKLVQKELYALTNLEAALVFVEGLTLNDFSGELQDQLSTNERSLLESSISSRITLRPLATENNASLQSEAPQPEVIRTNSYDGFRSAFDLSLKNIFDKIRSYTPPAPQQLPLPRSSSQFSLDAEKKSITAVPTNSTIPEAWKIYKEKNFEELRVNEMRDIFEIYQKLIK